MANDGRHDKLGHVRAALELLWTIIWPIEWFVETILTKNSFNDPAYKKNVQRLIERNRRFEESKE